MPANRDLAYDRVWPSVLPRIPAPLSLASPQYHKLGSQLTAARLSTSLLEPRKSPLSHGNSHVLVSLARTWRPCYSNGSHGSQQGGEQTQGPSCPETESGQDVRGGEADVRPSRRGGGGWPFRTAEAISKRPLREEVLSSQPGPCHRLGFSSHAYTYCLGSCRGGSLLALVHSLTVWQSDHSRGPRAGTITVREPDMFP